MTVSIGINPFTWSNDDLPSLGGATPLDVCLREGKQAGYAGFELGNKFPRQAEVLGSILAEHQLKLVSGWYSGRLLQQTVEEEIAALQSHLELLKILGCKVMVYCEVTGCIHRDLAAPISHRPRMTDSQWSEFCSRLSQVADYCLEQGVQLAYHHHMGTVVETEADIDRMMNNTGHSLGLLLDTGHLTYADGNPAAVAKRHADRINHVHCKDIRLNTLADVKNRDTSFLDAVLNGVFTVPGDGGVDFAAVFRELKAADYQGWLVVEAEQDPIVAPSLSAACLGADNLKKFCGDTQLDLTG